MRSVTIVIVVMVMVGIVVAMAFKSEYALVGCKQVYVIRVFVAYDISYFWFGFIRMRGDNTRWGKPWTRICFSRTQLVPVRVGDALFDDACDRG